jgi:hypothetical protein
MLLKLYFYVNQQQEKFLLPATPIPQHLQASLLKRFRGEPSKVPLIQRKLHDKINQPLLVQFNLLQPVLFPAG